MRKGYCFTLILFLLYFCAGGLFAQSYNVPSSGTQTVTMCSGTIYDPGGTGNYPNSCSGKLIVNSSSSNCLMHLQGTYNTENSYDHIYIYEGAGTNGTLLGSYMGQGNIDIITQSGTVTISFTSDGSVTYSGFQLSVSCLCGCENIGVPRNVVLQSLSGGLQVNWNAGLDPSVTSYYLEYGFRGFTPGSGTGAWVTGTSYLIPNIVPGQEYEVHIYSDCGSDGLITNEEYATGILTYNYNVPSSGTQTITICSGTIFDPGGTGNYSSNCSGILVVQPATPGCVVHIQGSYETESSYDKLYVYEGVGVGGTLYDTYSGQGNVNITSQTGALTLKFTSDGSVVKSGFELQVTCTGGCACGGSPVNAVPHYTNNGLHVTWNASLDPSVTSYYVEYGLAGFTPGSGTGAWVTSTSCDINGLVIGQNYEVHVYFDCGQDGVITNESYSSFVTCMPDTSSCIDLTTLTGPNILCQYGTFSNPYLNTGVVDNGWQTQSSRHTVNLVQATDPRTAGLLNILPPCEKYSVRLGNWSTGAQAESITYTFHVDTNDAAILLLKYAAVLQDPDHTASEQPRFKFELLDQSGALVDPTCGAADYIANQSLGWNLAGSNVLWKDWTTVGTDLSAYHGQNIRVRLTTYDCDQSGHYGYAYFHLNCKKKNITVESCGETTTNTYSAPSGFNYQWYYQSAPNNVISTQQAVTVPPGNDRLCCKVISLNNPNCFFTLWTSLTSRYPMADFTTTNTPCSYEYVFDNQSFVSSSQMVVAPTGESCESAYWDFGDGTTSNDFAPTHTFPGPGNYNVTMVARINNGQCTDTLTAVVNVLEHQVTGAVIDTAVCVLYQWNDSLYQQSGTFVRHFQAANGCDSAVTLHLTVRQPVTSAFSAAECGSYTWNGQTYQQSGNYVQHFQNMHGCDSAVTLHLTIHQPATSTFSATACSSYTWNGQTYTQSGDYVRHFQTSHGCDSTVTLHLTIHQPATSAFSAAECSSYTWNGQTYTQSGDYTQHFQTSHSCDSTVTLHLTIHQPAATEFADANCMHYQWNGQDYTQSGDYVQHFQTVHGCDSAVTLHLTILQTVSERIEANACDSFSWNAETYTESGDYTQQFTSFEGCDSVVTLHLTISPTTFVEIEDVACEGKPYRRYGFDVPAEQTVGRDSLRLEKLVQSSAGCDSTVTLRLTIADTALTVVSSATNLCDEPFVEISAEGAMSQYRWNTGETSQSIMVNNPGVYSVTVSDADCSVSKGVTIEPCMVDIILPNTITPGNHDNLNDWFELSPVFQSQMSDFSIRIFDRWGNVVFASRDKGFRWGGEVNGNLIPNTMYNYVIQYKDLYGEQFVLKGNLLVL